MEEFEGIVDDHNTHGALIKSLIESNSIENMSPIQKFTFGCIRSKRETQMDVGLLLEYMSSDNDIDVSMEDYLKVAIRYFNRELMEQIIIHHPTLLNQRAELCVKLLLYQIQLFPEAERLLLDYFNADIYPEVSNNILGIIVDQDNVQIASEFITNGQTTYNKLIGVLSQCTMSSTNKKDPINLIKYFHDNLENLDPDSVATFFLVCIYFDFWSDEIFDLIAAQPDMLNDFFRYSVEFSKHNSKYTFFRSMLVKYPDYDVTLIFTEDFCDTPLNLHAFLCCLKVFGENLVLNEYMYQNLFSAVFHADLVETIAYIKIFSAKYDLPPKLFNELLVSGLMKELSSLEQYKVILSGCDNLDEILLDFVKDFNRSVETQKINLILEKGADPNAFGGYIILTAIQRGHMDILQELLNHGANVSLIKSYVQNAKLESVSDLERYFPQVIPTNRCPHDKDSVAIAQYLLTKIVDHIEQTQVVPKLAFYKTALQEYFADTDGNFIEDCIVFDLFNISTQASFVSNFRETTQFDENFYVEQLTAKSSMRKFSQFGKHRTYITRRAIGAVKTMDLDLIAYMHNKLAKIAICGNDDLITLFKTCIENNFGELFVLLFSKSVFSSEQLDNILNFCLELSYIPHVKLYTDFVTQIIKSNDIQESVKAVINTLNYEIRECFF
jgi:hypothetical protein